MSSYAAVFRDNVDISGSIVISGDLSFNGTMGFGNSISLYGYVIPDPSGESNAVLTISGEDGYVWREVQESEVNNIGQTFYQIITEQPRTFTSVEKNGISFEQTTSTIDISWNFDNIIAVNDNNQQQILNISGEMVSSVLPCITKINVDISSTISNSGDVSESFYIDIHADDNYYVDNKSNSGAVVLGRLTYTLNYDGLRLNNSGIDLNTYTINVWGENSSNSTNIFNKLTYNGLQFKASGIPETPAIRNIDISATSSDQIEFTVDISTTDLDVDNSDTKLDGSIYIDKVDLSYSLIDASSDLLRSSFYGDGTHDPSTAVITGTIYNTDISHISLDYTGTEEVVGLKVNYTEDFYFGAKYDLQVKIKNNLAYNDTSYSNISRTSYTHIPDSDDISINTFNGNSLVLYNESNSTVSTISTINKTGIYLYNLAQIPSGNTDARIKPSNVGNRTIEISDPSKTLASNTAGFGKYIDNSTNLVTITCNLERSGVGSTDVSLQQLSYHGWNLSSPYTSVTSIADYSDNNIEPFTDVSASDIYSSEDKKGFRIKGIFATNDSGLQINDLSNAQLIVPFEASGNTGYRINYNYERQDSNNVTNDISSDYFFIDNFPNYADPSYNTNSSSVVVTDISWVMGIPQVSTVDISFTRNHININSEHKYFQEGGLVAKISSIKANGTNGTSVYSDNINISKYLCLTYTDLSTNGSYNGSFDGSLNYSMITSSQPSNKVISLEVNSTVYNLYTDISTDETFNVSHYRDVSSISNYSSVFTSNSTNRIYELSYNTITDLCSNFYNVHTSLDVYDNNNHEKEIQSHTIPFISGSFTVDSITYPDICGSFEWDGNIPNGYGNSVYDNSYVGIDLSGNSGDYKWIVYDVDMSDSSQYYNSSSSSYSSNVQGTGGEGINVTTIMNLLFDSNMISKFSFDGNNQLTNKDTYIFIVGYRNDTGKAGYYLGTMSKTFQASSSTTWYSNSNAGQTPLASILGKTDDRAGVSQSSSVTAISNMIGDSYNSWGSSDRIIQSLGSSAFTEYKLYFGIKIT